MRSSGPAYRIPGVVYQDEHRLQGYVEDGVLTQTTLAGAFREVVRENPGGTALCDPDWACSYSELDEATDRAAAAFLGLGLAPLDRVVFQLVNSKELVIAFMACLKAGLIPICTLASHRRLEIGYIGNHAVARAHFVQTDDPKFDFLAFSERMKEEVPTLQHVVAFGGPVPAGSSARSFDALVADQQLDAARDVLSRIELDPFQVAVFQLSGGTSGVPKIIPRFNNEYLYTVRTAIDCHDFDQSIVAYTPNPMIHNAPFVAVWGPALFSGGTVAICPGLDPSVVGPFFATRKPNWMLFPAPALMRLRDAGWLARLDLSGIRGFLAGSGAAKLRALLKDVPIWPTFGMTEGLICSANASDPRAAFEETVGRPLSPHDEIKVVDPAGEDELPDGEVGELLTRGPSTIRGYYDAPDRDALAFTRDGFYRTGDLMRIRVVEGRRYLLFEGRVKDVVDRGGEKINCEEVERVCAGHPAIGAVAVVAMPDPVYGQRACAFVIASLGASVPTVGELGSYLEVEGLAKFKWPERIEVVTEFPVTTSGKLSKPRLRELIEGLLRADSSDVVSA